MDRENGCFDWRKPVSTHPGAVFGAARTQAAWLRLTEVAAAVLSCCTTNLQNSAAKGRNDYFSRFEGWCVGSFAPLLASFGGCGLPMAPPGHVVSDELAARPALGTLPQPSFT